MTPRIVPRINARGVNSRRAALAGMYGFGRDGAVDDEGTGYLFL